MTPESDSGLTPFPTWAEFIEECARKHDESLDSWEAEESEQLHLDGMEEP